MTKSLRRHIYEVTEIGGNAHGLGRFFDVFMVILILLNLIAAVIETEKSIHDLYGVYFLYFEVFSLFIFTAEYLLRLWASVEYRQNPDGPGKFKYRAGFILSPLMIIDFLAIAPTIAFSMVGLDFRFLRVFRFLRIFKLMRYSPALASLFHVIYEERRPLMASLIIMGGLTLFAATIIYYLERHVQPDVFGSIPKAMWWSIATLTTVGYGDMIPLTASGRLFGGVMMVFGLGMYALPIGIIASGFASEIHRRDFVVRWGLVANVPLFSELDAGVITTIARSLRSRVVQAGALIASSGERAERMYLIVSGIVDQRSKTGRKSLEEGAFFGARCLMEQTAFSATYVAKAQTQLLVLEANDFHHLMDEHPALKERIEQSYSDSDKQDFGQPKIAPES